MAAPKFAKGAKVNHPADPDGTFPAGSGTVETVHTGSHGKPTTYRVKCDKTGKVLDCDFPESELTAV
jgi:hypothetical protein